MECKSEDSANIGRFWNNFKKTFKDVKKTDKKFFPGGWITVMATTNFNDLQLIYGEDIVHKSEDVNFISANQSTAMRQNVAVRSGLT